MQLTDDCPLVDVCIVANVMKLYLAKKLDYVCCGEPLTYPGGLDTENFKYKALATAHERNKHNHMEPGAPLLGVTHRVN